MTTQRINAGESERDAPPGPVDHAQEMLQELKQTLIGRAEEYGQPEENIKKVAELWSVYLNTELTSVDVCMLMTLLKVARAQCSDHSAPVPDDTLKDIAGYGAVAFGMKKQGVGGI